PASGVASLPVAGAAAEPSPPPVSVDVDGDVGGSPAGRLASTPANVTSVPSGAAPAGHAIFVPSPDASTTLHGSFLSLPFTASSTGALSVAPSAFLNVATRIASRCSVATTSVGVTFALSFATAVTLPAAGDLRRNLSSA